VLLKQATLKEVAAGRVTLAFRRWRRPTVRAGGTLLTSIGVLSIDAVDRVELAEITASEARSAGEADLAKLRRMLGEREGGAIYRVAFHRAGPDPRVSLRAELPDAAELHGLASRLARWDKASSLGPWTRQVLELLAANPGLRAVELAERMSVDKQRFKVNTRKLKGVGLTESLKVGYRLSPRGEALLEHLRTESG
jgi:hypothetical protein